MRLTLLLFYGCTFPFRHGLPVFWCYRSKGCHTARRNAPLLREYGQKPRPGIEPDQAPAARGKI